mmetsp:Transcript_44696/g.104410  ORF Transcript_44696/g.104410 Transcript_44696/m.104410 type:complete len:200 (-) Transcript_44696:1835-2434(-)
MGPIRPRPCWCVVVGVEQVHRVVHRQAHRGDHEDALVLTQAPSEEGHDSQEGRRDTNDANQAQGRRPPVPCGRQQNDPANQKGQADAHGGCLDHLVLGHKEEVQLRRLETSEIRRPGLLEGLPSVVPLVRLIHGVLAWESSVVADPCKLNGGFGVVEADSGVLGHEVCFIPTIDALEVVRLHLHIFLPFRRRGIAHRSG